MARRKADKIDIGQNSEKPERNKRESKALTIYRVELGNTGDELRLFALSDSSKDLKSATKQIQNMDADNYAVGRLTFISLQEQPSVKKVLVRK